MSKKSKLFKIIIFILFILLIVFLTIKVFPVFKNIFNEEGRLEFQKEIENFGVKGVLIILGLVVIQMFLMFLPVEPVEILAGMCYGSIGRTFSYVCWNYINSKFIILFNSKIWKEIHICNSFKRKN